MIATDLSPEALAVATINAANLQARVEFVRADLLKSFADSSVDVVVSNPPYVALADASAMQREVRDLGRTSWPCSRAQAASQSTNG